MSVARHPRPPELVGASLEQIMDRYVARFADRVPDWNAFSDANIDGYRRAQHRFVGAGASGKHDDSNIVPAGNFTLSIMLVPPGQGGAGGGQHLHPPEPGRRGRAEQQERSDGRRGAHGPRGDHDHPARRQRGQEALVSDNRH